MSFRNPQNGIDIHAGGSRPGGVPTHVTTTPAPAQNVNPNATYKKPATVDPFAALANGWKRLGRKMAG